MWPYGHRTCFQQQNSVQQHHQQHSSQHHSSMYQRCGSSNAPMCNGDCLLPGPFYAQTIPNNYRCKMSWCGQPPPSFHQYIADTPPSNTREIRNRAEKMRRDKLNAHISELATLVPMIATSAKRMDKTSILRLTATHLRIYHTLISKTTPKSGFNMVDQIALAQMIYEQLAGFLLIVTADGKIVFVSHTVEQILGHLQTDLMGQSIYTIASTDDHARLRIHLNPHSSDTDWRRYFRLSLAKAGPRSEAPQYETFSVMGMVRPDNSKKSRETSASTSKVSNEVFVFFVSLFRPTPPVERLMDPNRDEYVTRHLIDGRIINCDHRISLVAGYMIEEVAGKSAFNYMHKEDVRWTMIALRQMYDKGESQGWSCYRLQSRTGKFIYLRTCGYLELNNGVLESFICVNTLVDEDEGDRLIKEMKERYSVMINAALPLEPLSDISLASVEDPVQLDACIKHLITNIPPSPRIDNHGSSKPSSPFENQDCYLTDNPADSHAIEIKTRAKRATSDDEYTRKRHKRRAHSTEVITETYQQTSNNVTIIHSSTIYRPNMVNNCHVTMES